MQLVDKLHTKLVSFEYLLYKFMDWYEEYYQIKDETHQQFLHEFSRLKALKLLFLVSAIEDNNGCNLLTLFDKFYAMQHGPVESDIYNAMVNDSFIYFRFKNRETTLKKYPDYNLKDIDNKENLNYAVSLLKQANHKIISYSAIELVEITHKWISWKSAFMVAQMLGKGSQLMSSELIKGGNKFFS